MPSISLGATEYLEYSSYLHIWLTIPVLPSMRPSYIRSYLFFVCLKWISVTWNQKNTSTQVGKCLKKNRTLEKIWN